MRNSWKTQHLFLSIYKTKSPLIFINSKKKKKCIHSRDKWRRKWKITEEEKMKEIEHKWYFMELVMLARSRSCKTGCPILCEFGFSQKKKHMNEKEYIFRFQINKKKNMSEKWRTFCLVLAVFLLLASLSFSFSNDWPTRWQMVRISAIDMRPRPQTPHAIPSYFSEFVTVTTI